MIALPDGLLPAAWTWTALAAYAAALAWAVRRAPWTRLRDGEMQHVFLGASVLLMFLWTLRGAVAPGLGVHFLGATVLTLMFGPELALVALGLALAGSVLQGLGGWGTLGVNGLVAGVVPVAVSQGVLRLVERHLPPHLFVYIFLAAFWGAALAMAASVMVQVGVLAAAGVYSLGAMAGEYLPFLPLLMLPEAFLNGALVTALVGMRPGWIWTFDDARYLRGR